MKYLLILISFFSFSAFSIEKTTTEKFTSGFLDWVGKNSNYLELINTEGVLHMIAWLLAAILMVTALLKLKESAKDPKASYAAPIAYFLAALILANINQSINITTQAVTTNSQNLSVCGTNDVNPEQSCFSEYSQKDIEKLTKALKGKFKNKMSDSVAKGLVYLIKIIGFIYFVYGVMLIPKLSEPGSQITTTKPILHILFSSILINIPSMILS